MASNAGNSVAGVSAAGHSATSSTSNDILSSENWKFVECCKCREDVLMQDAQTGAVALRPDFWLTSCGHVGCTSCLDGKANCPKCGDQIADKLPVQAAQTDPRIAAYFRTTDGMIEDLHRTVNFQMDNLRDQTAYYKKLAKKQSSVLKQVKAELVELREAKKNYDALLRENNNLRTQLANQAAQQEVYQPQNIQPRSIHSTPQVQQAFLPGHNPPATTHRSRSGNATPVQLQGPTFTSQPQGSIHSTPMTTNARLVGRSTMNTPQPGTSNLPNRQVAVYPPTIGTGKRKMDDFMPDASSSGHRFSERDLLRGQGAISSAMVQQDEDVADIAMPDTNTTNAIRSLERFRNTPNQTSNPTSRPRSAQAQHVSRRTNQSLNTIPERNSQHQQQYTNEEEDMYQEAYQEPEDQQGLTTSRQPSIGIPASHNNTSFEGFRRAGEYTGNDNAQHYNPTLNVWRGKNTFQPLGPGRSIVPAQSRSRAFQPTNSRAPSQPGSRAGSRPPTAQGHRSAITIGPMNVGPQAAQGNVLRTSPRRGGSGNSSFIANLQSGGRNGNADVVKPGGFSYQNDQGIRR